MKLGGRLVEKVNLARVVVQEREMGDKCNKKIYCIHALNVRKEKATLHSVRCTSVICLQAFTEIHKIFNTL